MKIAIKKSFLQCLLGAAAGAAAVLTIAPAASAAATPVGAGYAKAQTAGFEYHAPKKVKHAKLVSRRGFGRSYRGFGHHGFKRHHAPPYYHSKSFGHYPEYGKGYYGKRYHHGGHRKFKKGYRFKKFFGFRG